MARAYDYLNQYYCPIVTGRGGTCVRPMCLQRRTHVLPADRSDDARYASALAGSGAALYRCYDPATGATALPIVWNPVYDRNTLPPGQPPAAPCPVRQDTCPWVWVLAAVLLAVALIILIAMVCSGCRARSAEQAPGARAVRPLPFAAAPTGAAATRASGAGWGAKVPFPAQPTRVWA
jgi:hypothetical protein